MLLNLGPKADGTIPEDQAEVLLEIGDWLQKNGRAIYSTRPWEVYGEGHTEVVVGHLSEKNSKDFTEEDIRFTTGKDGSLYILALDPPADNRIQFKYLADHDDVNPGTVESVTLLETGAPVKWEFTDDGLFLELENTGDLKYAVALEVNLE